MTHDLAQARDTETVLWTIAETSMKILGYEDCVIYLIDRDRDVLVQRAAFGPKDAGDGTIVEPIEIAVGDGIVGAVAAHARPIRVDYTRLDDRYIVDDDERRSELAVPIIDDGEVIGVIDSEHSQPSFYTDRDQDALVDLAGLAAARVRTALTIEQLQQARRELDQLASTDHLTGLPNRRAFEESLDDLRSRGRRPVIGMIDVDGFKTVNDEHGHAAGDEVLRRVAEVIRANTAQADLVARLGGDEFAVVADHHDREHVADMLRATSGAMAALRWDWNDIHLRVSVSAGVATVDPGDWSDADAALYLAKAQGRSQVVVFDPDDPRLTTRSHDRTWAVRVREGLSASRFVLHGQPIVDTTDSSDTPALREALLRYIDDDGTHVSPVTFLGAATRFGLSFDIDHWVINEAVAWLAANPAAPPLTVNVHPRTVVSGLIVPELHGALDATGVDATRLVVEITENAAIEDEAACRTAISTIRSWGARVAIDDFGSGWTSLAVARAVPVDFLKMDGVWVRDSVTDRLSRQVVQSTVAAAQTLGSLTVAEWVEDEPTRRFLVDLGVDYVQGHLTGRPAALNQA